MEASKTLEIQGLALQIKHTGKKQSLKDILETAP